MNLLTALILENEGFSLNDMTLIQRLMLKKVYAGKIDFERVTDKEAEVLDQLIDFGLLDLGYELTPDGEQAARLIDKYAKQEREDLAVAKQIAAEDDFSTDEDDYYTDDDFPFTESEIISMKAAGLNPKLVAKILKESKWSYTHFYKRPNDDKNLAVAFTGKECKECGRLSQSGKAGTMSLDEAKSTGLTEVNEKPYELTKGDVCDHCMQKDAVIPS